MRGSAAAGQREQREVATAARADVAVVAQHGRHASERRVPCERRSLLHGDELLEVLLEHVRRRDGEARLLGLAALERRAVRDREQRDADAEHEEDDREQHLAGRARERQEREPDGRRRTPSRPLEQAQHRREQARDGDGEHEEHEARQEEQQHAGSVAGRERAGVRLSAREREQDGAERAEGGNVCRPRS